jgi:hypothetical protein
LLQTFADHRLFEQGEDMKSVPDITFIFPVENMALSAIGSAAPDVVVRYRLLSLANKNLLPENVSKTKIGYHSLTGEKTFYTPPDRSPAHSNEVDMCNNKHNAIFRLSTCEHS